MKSCLVRFYRRMCAYQCHHT